MSKLYYVCTCIFVNIAATTGYNISSQTDIWHEPMHIDPAQSVWSDSGTTPPSMTQSSSSCPGNSICCWCMNTGSTYTRVSSTESFSSVELSYRVRAVDPLKGPDMCIIEYSVDGTNFNNIIASDTATSTVGTYSAWTVDNIPALTIQLTYEGGGHTCCFSEFKLSGIPSNPSRVPTIISNIWNDDYDITSASGWHITLPTTQKRIITTSCTTLTTYHGPYLGVNLGGGLDTIINVERDFYCEQDSSVVVSFNVGWCAGWQYDDYVRLYINDELKATATGNTAEDSDFTDSGITPRWCSYTWQQKSYPNLRYSQVSAADASFTVKVSIKTDYSYSQPEVLIFWGMQIICALSTKDPTIATTTRNPTSSPTLYPTNTPTNPTQNPTVSPMTATPTTNPTNVSQNPTFNPLKGPTASPHMYPTTSPTPSPIFTSTDIPSSNPTKHPSRNPTTAPITTRNPTNDPSETSNEDNDRDGRVNDEYRSTAPGDKDHESFMDQADFFGLPLLYGIILIIAFLAICIVKALLMWYYVCALRRTKKNEDIDQMVAAVTSEPECNVKEQELPPALNMDENKNHVQDEDDDGNHDTSEADNSCTDSEGLYHKSPTQACEVEQTAGKTVGASTAGADTSTVGPDV